jgi:carbonic anhydrase
VIDRFFEHLKFGEDGNPIVDQVAFGQIMNLANYEDRWVYHGSLTTPPCSPFIYWNVIRRVLPIKLADLEKF